MKDTPKSLIEKLHTEANESGIKPSVRTLLLQAAHIAEAHEMSINRTNHTVTGPQMVPVRKERYDKMVQALEYYSRGEDGARAWEALES